MKTNYKMKINKITNKNKWIKAAAIIIAIFFVSSAVVFAVSSTVNNSTGGSGASKVVSTKAVRAADAAGTGGLTQEKLTELYNKGYSVADIEKAAELAKAYGMMPDSILELKGKPEFVSVKSGSETAIADSSRTWASVTAELEIKKSMKSSGASDKKIADFGKQFQNQEKSGKMLTGTEMAKAKVMIDQSLIDKYNITSEDITKCKAQGIVQITDVVAAKQLVVKYNTTIDNVLAKKRNRNFWDDVDKELGGVSQ